MLAASYKTISRLDIGRKYRKEKRRRFAASAETNYVEWNHYDVLTSSQILWPWVSFKKIAPTTKVIPATVMGYHNPA